MNIQLVVGADNESVRTSEDKPFCRVYGEGKAFDATTDARIKTAELIRRWNIHETMREALEAIANLRAATASNSPFNEWGDFSKAQEIARAALKLAQP